jgi:4-hydroxy-tetrahydrodipicolinate reductase
VLVLGSGQMGSGIARLVLEKQGLQLVGVCERRADRGGMDVGEVLELDRPLGLLIDSDLDALVARTRPDIAIQATCSRLEEARGDLVTLLERGVNVISIAEEMAWPRAHAPELASRIAELSRDRGVSVLGTGVNPGFVLDLLVIALTGVCAHVESITATRVNDLSAYGPAVMRAQGVGLRPDAFEQGVANGSVVGHVGFPASIGMIAAAVGWQIDRIEETREPILARVERETAFAHVEAGCAAGCLHTAVAYRDDRPLITLIHPQQVRPDLEGVETGDSLEIRGVPNVRLAGSPEIPGGVATVAIAVNMIPHVLAAPPGLMSMADLPVPAAMMGDARELLERRAGSGRDA